jgi:hypothetical protein
MLFPYLLNACLLFPMILLEWIFSEEDRDSHDALDCGKEDDFFS